MLKLHRNHEKQHQKSIEICPKSFQNRPKKRSQIDESTSLERFRRQITPRLVPGRSGEFGGLRWPLAFALLVLRPLLFWSFGLRSFGISFFWSFGLWSVGLLVVWPFGFLAFDILVFWSYGLWSLCRFVWLRLVFTFLFADFVVWNFVKTRSRV